MVDNGYLICYVLITPFQNYSCCKPDKLWQVSGHSSVIVKPTEQTLSHIWGVCLLMFVVTKSASMIVHLYSIISLLSYVQALPSFIRYYISGSGTLGLKTLYINHLC